MKNGKGDWPSGKEESAFPGGRQELPFPFLVFWAMHLRNGNAQRRVPVSFSNLYVLEKVLWNSVSFFFWKSTPPSNPELKELWEDHILYEKQVEKLEAKAYRTPTEEQTLKQLKKQKLEGKTRLHAILDGYNEQEGN